MANRRWRDRHSMLVLTVAVIVFSVMGYAVWLMVGAQSCPGFGEALGLCSQRARGTADATP